jgi:hypothetical protein
MARFEEEQRNMSSTNYGKNNYTYRNGNLNIHYRKDADGRLIAVARPAFIKIK